ncbi:WbqC family protein [Pectinatus brassicae]|uniref:Glycine transferase n=1 Tax=Pectinatus brassicae TaxID=862415 RepID=A0A840UM27_9FIRM|nr:WbqC family protein [Pectinatus brassicae]MBB5336847.1 hypothetical protein [Pectinatus brassicae]
MKVAIMQPYFLPYLGYYSLLKQVDYYIYLDEVQYIYHGWIDRNRILKPNDGWQYIKVPIKKHNRETLIKDIIINNDNNWKDRILNQIIHYKKKANYYYKVKNLLEYVFDEEFTTISQLNIAMDKAVCDYLKIDTPINVFSKMDLNIETPVKADEWALNICKALGNIEAYWNAPGGKEFFDEKKYKDAGIEIKFPKINLTNYNQGNAVFEHALSILDVMMFNSVEEINKMLDSYSFI